ncbi:PAS domain-containing sensor histidine kinase [Clostridium sp. YIM B02515]|uniref:histidine kinase n=1 Tax=Clostridium rhizosphaerae TaxID=2803861 RepID=A0ABS1T9C3_9CLOT|nr:PAS domain-containing sensor histidine kinase [Clostridium rhizosphaerae]MBL4935861.1 PAS domain-containing sensor histidine kinase [Clostridium rhizosphaerae]
MSYEDKLKNSETILEVILKSTADGILVLDHNLKIIHINNSFRQLWNIPNEILLEKDGLKLANYIKYQLSEPETFVPRILSIIDSLVEHRDEIYFKNGKVFEQNFTPLIIDNNLSRMVWSYRDITSRVVLQKELIRSQKLYRRLIEHLPDAIFVYKDNKIFLVNEAAAKLLRKSKVDILGKHGGTLAKIHPDNKPIDMESIKKLHQSETSIEFREQKLILSDGTEIDTETGGFSFKNDDQLFVTTIVRDITERKKIHQLEKSILEKTEQLKAALEYNSLKTQFFSTISHELKTPLNIIFGSVQLLEKLDTPIHLKKYLKIMKQNCYRLIRLINNLIDINRIEVGFYKLQLKNYDIVKIIEDITLSVVEYTNSKGIELIFDTDVEEKIIACDAEKLERVILNLLSNAIKFTEPGGEIQVNMYDKEDIIIISIKDTGSGIPNEMLDKIFETFRQVDSSLRRKAEGSGIGLSLAKSLIEMHNGKISVKSEYGKGSEFIIELPVKLIANEDAVITRSINDSNNKIETVNIEFSDIYS